MRREYARADSSGWVDRSWRRKPRLDGSTDYPMSDLGREVAQVLGVVGGGIYNCPINVDKVNWWDDLYVEVYWSGCLANWDSPGLSLLLIECSRRMLRVSINPANMQGVRLVFHKRHSREGGIAERLPELSEIERTVAAWYTEKSEPHAFVGIGHDCEVCGSDNGDKRHCADEGPKG